MLIKETVNQLIEEFILPKEIYLVDLKISTDNNIQIEIDSFSGISLDDCVALNRYIESKLDREVEDYELEVSSAGLTEPFKVLKQYQKNMGKEVDVLLKDGLKYSGILLEADNKHIILEVQKAVKAEGAKRKTLISEKMNFTYEQIKTTKLIFTFK